MGKTSLLNVLPDWLLREPVRRGQHLAPTLIDYDAENGDLQSPQAFLLRVVKRLREGLRELGLCTIAERNFEPYFEGRTAADGFRDALTFLLDQARQASSAEGRPLRDVRLIGLVDDADEVARLPWASDLFRDLRDLYAHVEAVRRCLDLVLAGGAWLARHFGSGAPWAAGGWVSLCPMSPEAVSIWLKDASEDQLTHSLAQTVAAESGGHPFLISYFVNGILRQAERRGWDRLPADVMDRLAGRFVQQHQNVLQGWLRSLWQADPQNVTWATYQLLAEAGAAGLDTNDVDDTLWDLGLHTDVEQTLERLVWQGVASRVSGRPDTFVAKGMFRRYCQQEPTLAPRAESLDLPSITGRPHRRPPTMEYDDFDLRLSKEGDRYRVRVRSRWGEAGSQFVHPLSPSEQTAMWEKAVQSGHQQQSTPSQGQSASTSRGVELIGGQLFHAVFRDEVLARLRSAWENANRERLGLRIRLILEPPELRSLPWEFLYDGEGSLEFLALSRKTPLVRYVEQPTPVKAFRQVERLRLLFVAARSVLYPPLDLEQEVNNLCTALDPLRQQGRLEYRIVQGHDANANHLQEMLRQEEYHVFHFLGHGMFDEDSGEGTILLEGADGHGERLAAQRLARLLRDETDIRLAFLNACETARPSETTPFVSVAGALVRLGVPAVIGSQRTISDGAAVSFARKFYQALAEFHPLETAVAEGRKAIDISEENYEWGVPVLYLRARDGRVFQ
jgi:hypothetical protein